MKDFGGDSEDDIGRPMGASSSSRAASHKDDPSTATATARVTADDTDQGESDLESPN